MLVQASRRSVGAAPELNKHFSRLLRPRRGRSARHRWSLPSLRPPIRRLSRRQKLLGLMKRTRRERGLEGGWQTRRGPRGGPRVLGEVRARRGGIKRRCRPRTGAPRGPGPVTPVGHRSDRAEPQVQRMRQRAPSKRHARRAPRHGRRQRPPDDSKRCYRPRKTGGRFSRNAVSASLRSCVAITSSYAMLSASRTCQASTAFLAARMASGAPSQIS